MIPSAEKIKDVKNIILVSSGKGGVGKSTVASNLAIALANTGAKVALVDADIYGPSIPSLFGIEHEQINAFEEDGQTVFIPFEKHGIKLISIGFFVDPSKALVWRGPMASNALRQLFTDTRWGETDYMVVDLPPGTGDIQISISQMFEITGTILVSTPQQLSIADVRRAADMFRQKNVEIPILGLVENMAYFTPEELPNNKYYIFGKDGGKILSEEFGFPVLCQIPLVQALAEAGTSGSPLVLSENHLSAPIFKELAQKVINEIDLLNINCSKIEIEANLNNINKNSNNIKPNITMDGQTKTEMVQNVIAAIEQVRPYLQADGGDIAFVELTDDMIVKVRLQGACGSCPHSTMTLKNGVEVAIKKAIPEIVAVEQVF